MTEIETERPSTPHFGRFATDAFAGLGVFIVTTLLVAGGDTFAATLNASDPLMSNSPASSPVIVLAVVFSLLFAVNAAFFRHLGRTYRAAPRRGR